MVHLSGVKVSFFWAKFPSKYLDTIRSRNLSDLKAIPKVTLHHTEPQSLLMPEQRNKAIRDLVSIVRCIAVGYGKVGFLRRDVDTPVHRDLDIPDPSF